MWNIRSVQTHRERKWDLCWGYNFLLIRFITSSFVTFLRIWSFMFTFYGISTFSVKRPIRTFLYFVNGKIIIVDKVFYLLWKTFLLLLCLFFFFIKMEICLLSVAVVNFVFPRTNGPSSVQLGTGHSWVQGI